MSAMPSHVLMMMSETSRRLRATWNERQTPPMLTASPVLTGMLITRTMSMVMSARTSVTARHARMPREMPTTAMSAPPMSGETTIGTRFKIDCRVNPIARRSTGNESPMTAKIAGEAILCQAIANPSPTNTHGHEGLSR